MRIWLEKDDKNLDRKFSGRGVLLLKELGLYNEEVIISRNGEIVHDDAELSDSDEIKLLSVISGG